MPQEIAIQFESALHYLEQCVPSWAMLVSESLLAALATTMILLGVMMFSRTRIVIGFLLAVAALFLAVARLR
jgi:hypothetical protein